MTFEDDKLNRERYADFLTNYISNISRYKRRNDTSNIVMAIDSSWGTGKTTFIDMWSNKLNENNNNKFNIIKFNAWENDFVDEPLSALVYNLINADLYSNHRNNTRIQDAFKTIETSVMKIVSSGIKYKIRKAVGPDASDEIGDLIDEVKKTVIDGEKELLDGDISLSKEVLRFNQKYTEYKNALLEIKNALRIITERKKLVFFIDELDRCRPLFAIRLLESVKHIFDAENVIFVFALDMEQLSYSVKCVYGQGMDACGYLCRFFDFISKMPTPELREYIDYLVNLAPLNFSKLQESAMYSKKDFIRDITYISNGLKLSLRDINSIYKNFQIFEELELKETCSKSAYVIYYFIIALKYKYLDEFNNVFKNGEISFQDHSYIEVLLSGNYSFIYSFLNNIKQNKKICEINFKYIDEVYGKNINIGKIIQSNRVDTHYHFTGNVTGELANKTGTLSYVLFYDDFRKIEQIMNKNISNYIEEKLEFFDFQIDMKNKIKI